MKKGKSGKRQTGEEDRVRELEYYHPKKRKQIPQKYIVGAALVLLAGTAVMFSPVFTVKEIRLEHSKNFTTTELADEIGLAKGDNMILFSRLRAENILKKNPYIQHADLIMELPSTMVISLTERKVRAYIPYMDSYLYIDEEGRVLDIQDTYEPGLPLVEGLQFSEFHLGDIIEVENAESLRIMLQISQMVEKYDFKNTEVTLDVSDHQNIHGHVGNVQVLLGTMDNMDQKIRTIAEFVKVRPKEDRGSIDLRDPSKRIIFQYLT